MSYRVCVNQTRVVMHITWFFIDGIARGCHVNLLAVGFKYVRCNPKSYYRLQAFLITRVNFWVYERHVGMHNYVKCQFNFSQCQVLYSHCYWLIPKKNYFCVIFEQTWPSNDEINKLNVWLEVPSYTELMEFEDYLVIASMKNLKSFMSREHQIRHIPN